MEGYHSKPLSEIAKHDWCMHFVMQHDRTLVSKLAVESLNVGVLRRFARNHELQIGIRTAPVGATIERLLVNSGPRSVQTARGSATKRNPTHIFHFRLKADCSREAWTGVTIPLRPPPDGVSPRSQNLGALPHCRPCRGRCLPRAFGARCSNFW